MSSHQPPVGPEWLIEIKHDGFRVIARKEGNRVRLYSRPGNDLTYRFPLIAEALVQLRSRSCIIDGEAVACGADGIASFNRIRYRRHDAEVFLYAFDLIEFNGDDLRRDPLVVRKATLERLLARAAPGLRYNEHLDQEDGPLVFMHACNLGQRGLGQMAEKDQALESITLGHTPFERKGSKDQRRCPCLMYLFAFIPDHLACRRGPQRLDRRSVIRLCN